MENNNRLVANGISWFYYFRYLKTVLAGLPNKVENSEWRAVLSSKKLFILLPCDCYAYGSLSREDRNIEILPGAVIEHRAYRAGAPKVYRLNVYKINRADNCPLYVLAHYASALCCLYDMSCSSDVKLSREDRDEQAMLFLRTLETILQHPSVPEVRNNYILVPYARNSGVRLSEVLAEAVLANMCKDLHKSKRTSEISLDELDGVNPG